MALITTPYKGQPNTKTGINWAHPRSSGLVWFIPGGDNAGGFRELVKGNDPTITGLGTTAILGSCQTRLFNGSSYADFVVPPEIGPTTPFTMAWTQQAINNSGYNTLASVQFGTPGVHYSMAIYQSSIDSSYEFAAGPRVAAGAHRWTTGLTPSGTVQRFLLQVAGGSQSLVNTQWALWRDGVQLTRSTSESFSINTTAQSRLGAREGGADPWRGLITDFRLWSRVLTDEEAARESVVDSVGDLYLPRKIFVPISSGGGASTYTFAVSGGATFSGASPLVRERVQTPSGGLNLSGAPIISHDRVLESAGEVLFSGTAPIITTASHQLIPSGGIIFLGSSEMIREKVLTPSGGIEFGGTARLIFAPAGGVGNNDSDRISVGVSRKVGVS